MIIFDFFFFGHSHPLILNFYYFVLFLFCILFIYLLLLLLFSFSYFLFHFFIFFTFSFLLSLPTILPPTLPTPILSHLPILLPISHDQRRFLPLPLHFFFFVSTFSLVFLSPSYTHTTSPLDYLFPLYFFFFFLFFSPWNPQYPDPMHLATQPSIALKA